MSRVLVAGATGRLGRLVTAGLIDSGVPVRVLTRRPEAARLLFGDRVEIAEGAFADAASISQATNDTDRLFLLSPIGETLAEEQIALANTAVAAGVRRIVKISGSHWTIEPPGVSISGDAHAAVERHLATLPVEHVSLRPNAWMQVGLAGIVRRAEAGETLHAGKDAPGVAYIDARDIADVAVHQLLAERVESAPLVLTGPEAVTTHEIATLLAGHLCRPVAVSEGSNPPAPRPVEDFEHRAVAQFLTLIGAGKAAPVTSTIPALLGRPARDVSAFIAEHFASRPGASRSA